MRVFDHWSDIKVDLKRSGAEVSEKHLPAREPVLGELDPSISGQLYDRSYELGVEKLFSHQADAISAVREHQNVIITAGTAAGKTLCYNLPVFETILKEPKRTALYLFPTKALANDQLRGILNWELKGIRPATYDGDTPSPERIWARKHANIILTNPDMLSCGILPSHAKWGDFLLNLRFVVIDEAHVLKGVFGTHVALVIRRLRRVLKLYGADPVFILTSATIANPGQHAVSMTGLPFKEVEADGSENSEKIFALVNPPIIERVLNRRKSSNIETVRIIKELVQNKVRTIAFSKTRKSAELIYHYLIKDRDFPESKKISSYRAGFTPKVRRQIEGDLASGKLLGVSTTNALELGIDIGHLDATIINGYPGTISSCWQQAGRSGRRDRESLAVMIASADPLDQYIVTHPGYLFGKPFESALTDPDNEYIMAKHVAAAADETPIVEDDALYFGSGLGAISQDLFSRKILSRRDGKLFLRDKHWGAATINLRSASQHVFQLIEASSGEIVATVDDSRVFFEAHEGAVYLHLGKGYLVAELDIKRKVAFIDEADLDHYTQPLDLTDIEIIKELRQERFEGFTLHFGKVLVTTTVMAFVRKAISDQTILGYGELDLPPMSLQTDAFWVSLDGSAVANLKSSTGNETFNELELAGAIHAAEHAMIAMMPLLTMSDRSDIGGVSTPLHHQTGQTSIFVYDAYEGGVGIAKAGYERFAELTHMTLEMVRDCPCETGCPSCIQSPKCGNMNEPLFKDGAIKVLQLLISC